MIKFFRFLVHRWDKLDGFQKVSVWFFFTFGGFMTFSILSVVNGWFFVVAVFWVLLCFAPLIKDFLVDLVGDWRGFK